MGQSLNGCANRCMNNARTFGWAGSAVSVLPVFLPMRAPTDQRVQKIRILNTRKSESLTPENPNLVQGDWRKGIGARGQVCLHHVGAK